MTEQTMIERMARAIFRKAALRAKDSEAEWYLAVEVARAVLTAMREPSEAMLAGGRDANDAYAAEIAPCSAIRALAAWQAMIDTALAEAGKEKHNITET